MIRLLVVASAFLRAFTAQRRFRTRDTLDAWQVRRIKRLVRHAATTTEFYAGCKGCALADLPIVTKDIVQSAFGRFNTLGLDAARAWDVLEGRASLSGHEVGVSAGTTGQHGLYLVSEGERFRWLGTILAKALPDIPLRRHRVAVVLPGAAPLYQTANQSRLLDLVALDPRSGLDACRAALEAFAPSVIVAAPKTLRWLAETGVQIEPSRIFAASEVLDPSDRAIVERRFRSPLGRIYMASEGLFGVTCRHARLHLAEDVVHFELEPVSDDPGLVTPIVTDFTRRTQILARYRIGDLLRVDPAPCACGCPFTVVDVVGRRDDLYILRSGMGGPAVHLAADRLTAAILGQSGPIDDFRLYRLSDDRILLVVRDQVDMAIAEATRTSLEDWCRGQGADVKVILDHAPLEPPFDRKLRRVIAQPPAQP